MIKVLAEENNDRNHHIWMDCRRLDMNKIGIAISIFREKVETFSAQWTWHDEDFCSMGITSSDICSIAQKADYITWKSESRFLWMLPNSGWGLGSKFWVREKKNPCRGNTSLHLFKKHVPFICRERNDFNFLTQKALCLLKIFKRAEPSMENSMSTCWRSYECRKSQK